MAKIKMLLWDVDGTLLDFLEAEKTAIRACFGRFGLGQCTDEMLAEYSQINKRYWRMLEKGEMSKPEILMGRFQEFFGNHGIDTEVAEAFNSEYQIRLGDTIVFFENAFDTVSRLKGKFVQCAVTNGTRTAQERKLRDSGLAEIFDHIFISENIGYEKPAVEFFEAVRETTGINMNESMIIGDSLTSDIKGGNNAGAVTCWYNPKGTDASGDVKIDYEIRDLAEVVKILESDLADRDCR